MLYLLKYPNLLIFGEDVGNIGDVNQGLEGLQKKHGAVKVADTSIRETAIVGQGIGMAMRGLRPIAEIQYLDYILYGLQTLSDDLASLHYRTFGKQMATSYYQNERTSLARYLACGFTYGGIVSFFKRNVYSHPT